ncbi:MAG: NfeD family protein [Dysgonomonas sp.]|jgi:membrane protein implicated in regulation of membrane protease activity|nr:NfeD family protein [Prevotella sp.]MDR3058749.1 NfeD family protein [Prevotella sp.]
MKEFFASMDGAQQFYWYIAIGASVIFIIQTIMTFIGADADTGVDADFDGNLDGGDSPFQLFSLRNLINFLLGFGWTGVSLYNLIPNKIVLGVVALFVGIVFIAIFFFIMRALMKLSEDNSFKIEETIGKTADVYLTIPAAKSGKGKIFISVKGSTHELSAITADMAEIKNGTLVKVIGIEGDILVVTPLSL